jgi:hypothetical protein
MILLKTIYRIILHEGITILMALILAFFLWLYIGLPYRAFPSWLYETKTAEFECQVRIFAKSGESGLICEPDVVKAKISGLASTVSRIQSDNIVAWVEPDYEILNIAGSYLAKVNVRIEGIIAFVDIKLEPERVLLKKFSPKSK